MTNKDNEVQLPSHHLLGGIGVILLLISIYIFNNYYLVRYPSKLNNSDNFFLMFEEVGRFINHFPFTNIPSAVVALFFSLSFISFFIVNIEKYLRLAVYVIILNILFSIVFCVLPTLRLESFSLLHFFYFVFSLIPAIYLRKSYFGKPNTPYVAIVPVLFLIINFTATKIETINSANSGIIQANMALEVSAQRALPTPKPENYYWIFTSGRGFDNARMKATLFTGLTCKKCKEMSEFLKIIRRHYAGFLTVQFIPFPHSRKCNPYYKGLEEEPEDCDLTRWALCNGNKIFPQAYEQIMEAPNFPTSNEELHEIAKRSGKQDCFKLKPGEDMMKSYIDLAAPYNLKETPALMVNGIMIPPPYNFQNVSAYLNELMKRGF